MEWKHCDRGFVFVAVFFNRVCKGLLYMIGESVNNILTPKAPTPYRKQYCFFVANIKFDTSLERFKSTPPEPCLG